MAIDRTEFEQVSRHIRDLLSHSDTQKYTDPIDQARSDAVRKIFSSGDTRAIASVLDTWNDEGPLTFDYQWRVVKAALEDWGNDSSRALRSYVTATSCKRYLRIAGYSQNCYCVVLRQM